MGRSGSTRPRKRPYVLASSRAAFHSYPPDGNRTKSGLDCLCCILYHSPPPLLANGTNPGAVFLRFAPGCLYIAGAKEGYVGLAEESFGAAR